MTGLDAELLVRRGDGFVLDLHLEAEPGRTVALLGPNGAGKSTLVEAVAGLVAIDGGRVSLAGRLLDDPASGVFVATEDRRIGIVFQDRLLFPHMSLRANVAFGLRSRGVPVREAHARSEAWLGRVGLAGMENRRPGDISGGEAQRVALARALAPEPDLLLLDEPLSALDVSIRPAVRRLLETHLEVFSGPRVLITHDPAEAFLLGDVVHVLEGGTITQIGTAEEIRLGPRTSYAADLAGVNLFEASLRDGVADVEGHALYVVSDVEGDALVTIHPRSVSVHRSRPGGSPRNSWSTTVERIEELGGRVRIQLGGPLPMTAELTSGSVAELGLVVGSTVWLAVKATDVGVDPLDA